VEICINNYPVDFELEGEETVSDIVDSISQWARERELIFTEVHIDDERYYIDELPQGSLDNVSIINCVVRSKADVVFTTIDEGIRYCDRVNSFITAESGAGNAEDLATGIDWLIEVVDALFGLLAISPEDVKVRDIQASALIDEMTSLREKLNSAGGDETLSLVKDSGRLFGNIREMFKLLIVSDEMRQLIVQSIDSPDAILHSLKSLKEEFPGQIKNIEETAIAYQTGKDADGSAGMDRFIDFIYRYTRTCYQAVPVFEIDLKALEINGVSLEEKNGMLHDFLNQTIIILENNDIISLSDILEYEILPALEDLGDYLDLLIDVITGGE